MSFLFNPHDRMIVVGAQLYGPSNKIVLRLALDTGSSRTMVAIAPLVTVGYEPALAGDVFGSPLRRALHPCPD